MGQDNIITNSDYRPWELDQEFRNVSAAIRGYTLVDVYRNFELWEAVERVARYGDHSIIEVGAYRGGTAATMTKKAQMLGIKKPVIVCDTFKGCVKGEGDYMNGAHRADRKTVEELFAKMNLTNHKILEGIFPDETANQLDPNTTFSLLHVDVDNYRSTKDVVDYIWPRMIVGGIIMCDDYGNKLCPGVIKWMKEQSKMDDRVAFYNLNGHGIVVKIK